MAFLLLLEIQWFFSAQRVHPTGRERTSMISENCVQRKFDLSYHHGEGCTLNSQREGPRAWQEAESSTCRGSPTSHSMLPTPCPLKDNFTFLQHRSQHGRKAPKVPEESGMSLARRKEVELQPGEKNCMGCPSKDSWATQRPKEWGEHNLREP